jgi:peptidoglycan-associated lipoprotein
MSKHPLCLLALASILALAAACGPKRPPAVASAPLPTGTGASPTAASEVPVDAGPDVRAVDAEQLGGQLLGTSDMAGTGLADASSPLADILFSYDSAELSPEARATLERHARWLQQNPAVKVIVEGHCDERGTAEYNLALGDQRAAGARDYLASLGVAPERMTTVSYGKEQPLDAGSGEAAWARNRRAHFAVSR